MTAISIRERMATGKSLREQLSRADHALWSAPVDRRDPIDVLEHCNRGRLPELVPIRYGRMLQDPFVFLRGSPAVMARDLASTSVTGIAVQACGDCHLTNFGLFATPERNLIFDLNDFDETLRAPWEWDLKRLATSFVVAGRVHGIAERRARDAAIASVRSYREHLREFAMMSPLDIWYYQISAGTLIECAPDARSRKYRERLADKARRRVGESLFPKITQEVDGQHHFVEQPPLMTRITDSGTQDVIRAGLEDYRQSLSDDRRFVFDRYRLEDFALRVVGVGSVATRCFVALLFCDDKNSLLLQIKEARRSVLEPYVEACHFDNQGQRVVVGQRLIQAASDMFLGWLRAASGHDFYVRQLRDMKFSVPIDDLTATQFERYAEVCGWTLARAHARSADAATISGYLGTNSSFERALGKFAVTYADQIERDHAVLVEANRAGRIKAHEVDV